MAKQAHRVDPEALLQRMELMAEETKTAISDLQQAIREIDIKADEEKKPIYDQIKRLNDAYSRMTGKSHLRNDAPSALPKTGGGNRRSSALMQELATQVHNVIKKHRDGILGNDIRKEVDGLEPNDNLSLLLKKYKMTFSTEGPRRAMKYLPA